MAVPALWSEHRMIAESIGQAVSDAITAVVGTNVDLGIAESCDPADMLVGRPMPIRAIVVEFERPLRDVMIFVSSLKEDVVRPLVEVAATAVLASLDISSTSDAVGEVGPFSIARAAEFETMEDALEQCDALFLEATYSLDMPTGELQMVLGTGLLESASCFVNGIADPFAEGARSELDLEEDGELVLGDRIGGLDDGVLELERDAIGGEIEAADLHFAGTSPAATPASGLDALDAMLAQQEQAERSAVAALDDARRSAHANVADAAPSSFVEGQTSERWTQLLSGVEVELSAELGRMDLALGDIASLAADSVLTLDQMVSEPVGVFVNGMRYATARLVVVDGEYGIEILEVVDQSELLTAFAA